MDVVSLYTNIPHKEAIEYTCEHYSNTLHRWKHYNTRVIAIDVGNLKKLLHLMLSNCTLEFNKEFFTQLYGTPMGAPASVRIANIFMYKLLVKFLTQYEGYKPPFIGRLIDDLFMIWNSSEKSLLTFHNSLNNFHSTIKFEINYSTVKVNFLDTTVYIEDSLIKTTLYTKPTDKKQYLAYSSNHPRHTMKAIPYSQALRYKRIITDNEILKNELDTLLHRFTSRGYPTTETTQQISKVYLLNRTDTLQYKSHTQKRLEFKIYTKGGPFLPLIITYRPEFIRNPNNLYKLLETLWQKYIKDSVEFKDTFDKTSPKIVF